jgi:hypothetical protein
MPDELELTDADKQLVKKIQARYFLFPKSTVIGSAIGILVAVGIISFGAAKGVIESSTTKQAAEQVTALLTQAKNDAKVVADIRAGLQKDPMTVTIQNQGDDSALLTLVAGAPGTMQTLQYADINGRDPSKAKPSQRWILKLAPTQ